MTVQGVDEQETEHHALMAEADDLGGMPVVVADLHSALPAVLIGMLATDPDLKVAYVMTDGGALPAAFSRTLDTLAPSLAGVVTVGQAFGGDLEAVTRAHRAAGGAARAAAPTWRSSRRGRATWAPGRRGASPAWPPARRATPSPCSAARRSARCGSPTPTRGRGTAGSPTTR